MPAPTSAANPDSSTSTAGPSSATSTAAKALDPAEIFAPVLADPQSVAPAPMAGHEPDGSYLSSDNYLIDSWPSAGEHRLALQTSTSGRGIYQLEGSAAAGQTSCSFMGRSATPPTTISCEACLPRIMRTRLPGCGSWCSTVHRYLLPARSMTPAPGKAGWYGCPNLQATRKAGRPTRTNGSKSVRGPQKPPSPRIPRCPWVSCA